MVMTTKIGTSGKAATGGPSLKAGDIGSDLGVSTV